MIKLTPVKVTVMGLSTSALDRAGETSSNEGDRPVRVSPPSMAYLYPSLAGRQPVESIPSSLALPCQLY